MIKYNKLISWLLIWDKNNYIIEIGQIEKNSEWLPIFIFYTYSSLYHREKRKNKDFSRIT